MSLSSDKNCQSFEMAVYQDPFFIIHWAGIYFSINLDDLVIKENIKNLPKESNLFCSLSCKIEFPNLNFILTELIQKAKDAVEVKKREDLKMLKEQMEDALKVRTAFLWSRQEVRILKP